MDAKLVSLSKRRIGLVQEKMRGLGLDASLVLGSGLGGTLLERLCGSRSGTVLVIPAEGEPSLAVMPIDYTFSSDNAWCRVVQASEEASLKRDWIPAAEEALGGAKTRKIGVTTGALNAAQLEWLKKKGAEAVDIKEQILDPLFAALDPVEYPYQRKITEIVDVGQTAAHEAVRPGATTNEVAAIIAAAELKAGASGVGYLQVSTGRRSAYSHDSAENIVIKKGDLVLVDLCPTLDGYGSDETRTYTAGKSTDKARKMILAVDRSVEAVLAAVKLGGNAGELDAISRNVLKEAGYPSYPHTLGHPLSGCTQPALRPNSSHTLREGSIFTVEPGIYALGYGGVRIEENVLVTKKGVEILTKRPRTSLD